MKTLVIQSSPNKEGLTAACADAALEGVRLGGGEAEMVRLNDLDIRHCFACNQGWGKCRSEHECGRIDDFQALHARLVEFDAYVLVTPVYWHEPSEFMKAFCDRLRRCEGTAGEQSRLRDKPFIAVAAAGGSGNGTITTLLSMEKWIQHVGGKPYDLIAVNRWTRPFKLDTIRASARAMAEGKK